MTPFFARLYKSIYSPKFYQEVIQQPPKQAVKYYIGMVSLVAIIAAVLVSLVTAPIVKTFISELGIQAVNIFPQDAKLTIKNGNASINKPEPFLVRLPESFIEGQRSQGSVAPLEYAIVVDTKTPFSYESFARYNAFAWITANGIGVLDQDLRARYVEFSSSTNQIIDKPLVAGLVERGVRIVHNLVWLLPPFFFIFVFFLGLFNLAYCALLAFLIRVMVNNFVANKAGKFLVSYRQAWAATLHLVTLGTLWAVIDICIPEFRIPFGFTIITLVLAYVNMGRPMAGIPQQNQPQNQGEIPPLPPPAI